MLESPQDPTRHLRRAIEESRRQITDNIELLQDEVEERVNWRGWVDKHPWEAVGIVFCVGVFLGARPYL